MLNQNLLLAGDDGYNLSKSLRFRSSASAYLSRTPASAGNRRTWTYSDWVKRGSLTSFQFLLSTGTAGSSDASIYFTSIDALKFEDRSGTGVTSAAKYRDIAAYYHVVVAVDTTQATDSNRVKMYVNGSQITSFDGTPTYPTQNSDLYINNSTLHYVGRRSDGYYFDGYQAETNFIDGQALTPSSFGETDVLTGVWKPKKYAGTYGTNGFYLPFTDVATTSGSNAGLGKDFSGNGNYWNTNNISVTAGSTYDSMTDVPTLTSATQANYCVLNPLDNSGTLTNGNLTLTATSGNQASRATIQLPASGKFYAECTLGTTTASNVGEAFGFALSTSPLTTSPNVAGEYKYVIYADSTGAIYANGSTLTSSLGAFSSGTVLQIAYDGSTGNAWVGKNNTWYNSSGGTTGDPATGANPTFTSLANVFPFVQGAAAGVNPTQYANFGQQPFSYTPPTGFVALNTFNLPEPSIKAGNKHMDVNTYTGNGGTLAITNAGAMKPDFVWIKGRNAGYYHCLQDSIRGVSGTLFSNASIAEETNQPRLSSFNSNGFTLTSKNDANNSGDTYVGWQWQAGQGTTSSNTAGSITSTVSVNPTAGFSVVTYTGTGANATVGHGLGVAPSMVIIKSRVNAYNWVVYNANIGNTNKLYLDLTDASVTDSTAWNNTSPTSSTFSLGSNVGVNQSGSTYVAYCWSEVAGYSKFGSYTGNGSTDGPFIYTGFRPRFFMIKRTDTTTNWIMYDTARQPYNTTNPGPIYANLSSAEESNVTLTAFDVLSNGFKPRNTSSWAESNASGGSYIYMAFAENPFRNALAR